MVYLFMKYSVDIKNHVFEKEGKMFTKKMLNE